ncbi:hypothetical protein [Nonomuraea antimicrobica]
MSTSFDGMLQVPLDTLPDEDALTLLMHLLGKECITRRTLVADNRPVGDYAITAGVVSSPW